MFMVAIKTPVTASEITYELGVGVLIVFFFFQAEDGIRDVAVTGVQTCALPIYGESQRVLELARRQYQARRARSRGCRTGAEAQHQQRAHGPRGDPHAVRA